MSHLKITIDPGYTSNQLIMYGGITTVCTQHILALYGQHLQFLNAATRSR